MLNFEKYTKHKAMETSLSLLGLTTAEQKE